MSMGRCLTKNCARSATAHSRGLCLVCYSRAKKAVADGKTTWDELVDLGLARGSDGDDVFLKGLKDAREGRDAATPTS